MSYKPSYSKDKIEILRKYVNNYIAKFDNAEKAAASVVQEAVSYRTIISRKPTDGDQRYIYFNNLFFDGKLPSNVKVYFINSNDNKKNSTGFSNEYQRNGYNLMMADKNENILGCWIPQSESIYLFLDRIGEEDFSIDTVLIHEMCHVWQDRVYSGINNNQSHGTVFQYARKRTENRSRGIYDSGAVTDINKKSKDYKKGVYGDPGIGRTENALKKHYEKRFEQNNIMKSSHLHIDNLDNKYFRSEKTYYRFTGEKFVPVSISDVAKFISSSFNKNEELINFVKNAFNQIRNHRDFY